MGDFFKKQYKVQLSNDVSPFIVDIFFIGTNVQKNN